MSDDARYGAERPARRSFLSRLIHWHLREWLVVAGVVFAVGTVVVNALFLQTGPHPTPIFANRPAPTPAVYEPVTILPRPRPASIRADLTMPSTPNMPAAPARDPIADLLSSPKRVAALQRTLAEYGYGQIKPTGTLDPPTRSAIVEFERNRKLPVTGQLSDRVTRELVAMTGRLLD